MVQLRRTLGGLLCAACLVSCQQQEPKSADDSAEAVLWPEKPPADFTPAWAVLGDRATLRLSPEVSMDFVLVPAGSFTMGASESGDVFSPDQLPATNVALTEAFWMARLETTQAQWSMVMEGNPSRHTNPDNPVDSVSWIQAMEFCERLQAFGIPATLPTEAQWEYACWAGSFDESPEDLARMAWFSRTNDANRPRKGGLLQPNGLGLFDLLGNMEEWCLDWYAPYSGDVEVDPSGPEDGEEKVARGGHWYSMVAPQVTCSARSHYPPGHHCDCLGFRVIVPSNP